MVHGACTCAAWRARKRCPHAWGDAGAGLAQASGRCLGGDIQDPAYPYTHTRAHTHACAPFPGARGGAAVSTGPTCEAARSQRCGLKQPGRAPLTARRARGPSEELFVSGAGREARGCLAMGVRARARLTISPRVCQPPFPNTFLMDPWINGLLCLRAGEPFARPAGLPRFQLQMLISSARHHATTTPSRP